MAAVSFNAESADRLRRLQGFFARRRTRAYLVGGSVRDALLGKDSGDIDLAVEGSIDETVAALGTALPATVVALDEDRRVYRLADRDGAVSVDVSPLHGDVASDARRRDFTVDALTVPLDDLDLDAGQANVLDPIGGLTDLDRGIVRATGDDIFLEDGARLLRAVRLVAELGFEIEPHTADLIRRDVSRLDGVSRERVRDELCRMLAPPRAARHLRLLDELGLLPRILPELEEARGVSQPKEHHWDVFQHSIETVASLEQVLREAPAGDTVLGQVPWDDELAAHFREHVAGGRSRAVLAKLAALLHDVAKPATKTVEPSGRIRFLRHPGVGADMTRRILERLRFSNREVRMVAVMVDEHLRPGLISRGEEEPTRRALYRFFRDAGDVTIDTLLLSFADYLAARGPLLEQEDWRGYAGKVAGILRDYRTGLEEPRPARLLNGHDLMGAFNLQPGPHLGALLEAVSEAQATGASSTREEALALVERMLKREAAVA